MAPHWRSVGMDITEVSTGSLSAGVDAQLQEAMLKKRPMVIRHRKIAEGSTRLHESWFHFVTSDTEWYQVNQGAKTDNADGSSSHSPGLLPLAQIWRESRRLEVGLKEATHGQTNPVVKWLRRCQHTELEADGVAKLLCSLRRLLIITSQPQAKIFEPAFIAGAVQPGGGLTHFDDYDNLAVVLVGRKTFYIAPPSMFADAPRRGEDNERLSVSPHDRLTSKTEDWEVAELAAGDILYLPIGWWHFVDSAPLTVMTNIWSRPREV